MNRCVFFILFIFSLGLLATSCQSKKQLSGTNAEQPAVATLAKTTYKPGDTISIRLAQPLASVTVMVDSQQAVILKQADTVVSIRSTASRVGLHQVVVRGVTTSKLTIADTLDIELWSDSTPRPIQYTVLKTYPHQASSFTQGLEFQGKTLYESTGQNGQSKLMQIDLATGAPIRTVSLANQYFGEGITIVNGKIYQLTWTSGVCFQYKMDFTLEKTLAYHTQGWGLTHVDSTLILSDGTNKLYFLTPGFQRIREVAVYDNTGPIMNLNELEYVDGYVFANVWQTNRIVQIDLASGKVVGDLHMEAIGPPGVDTNINVLNGIAFQPAENAFYVTGKNWPTLTKIRLLPKGSSSVASR